MEAIVNATQHDAIEINDIHLKVSKLIHALIELEAVISKSAQLVDKQQRTSKLEEIRRHLSEAQQQFDTSLNATLGRTLAEVNRETLQLAKKFGKLSRWLDGRGIDARKLKKHLQVLRQDAMIQRTCENVQAEVQQRNVGLSRRASIPLYGLGKRAFCEHLCGF